MNRYTPKEMCLAILILSTVNSCTQQAEPATYFLPQHFEGVFAVVYNQEHGMSKMSNKGRRQFIIPGNGILVTQFSFSDGSRRDIFLMRTNEGYDTLKYYLPDKDTTGKRFDEAYYNGYTKSADEYAVNFRQIQKPTFNKFNTAGDKIGSCSFEYELITIGRANSLNDSTGKAFIERLDRYLQETFCN
jgi:hypothetical protein